MSLKLTHIATRVRHDSLGSLAREALLRISHRVRASRFHAEIHQTPDVRYCPISYYRPALEAISAEARQATVQFADSVLRGKFPLLGDGSVALGFPPDWNTDWVSGKSWPLASAKSLTVVRHDGSDVKAPWELSRLQFLPVLAKSNMLTGDERYRKAARELISDWIDRNTIGMGVNWTIAMEAALRAISICLTLELLWPLREDEQTWLHKVTTSLWQHVLFIEAYNEYSHLVRSNHYLSNMVGLTTLSAALRGPGMEERFHRYANAVQQEILLQTYADGGDYEASTGYHVLVSQMFLHSYLVQRARGMAIGPRFEQRLISMFDWLATLADDQGTLPQFGDCDDGRVELLLDDIRQTSLLVEQRNSLKIGSYLGLASCLFNKPFGGDGSDAIWFGAPSMSAANRERRRVEVLGESGLAIARCGEAEVIFSAMPNGIKGRGSHTHCDKLSFVLRVDGAEVFCDSGTACYTRDAERRNRYRSTSAHNTVTVDELEQNTIDHDTKQLFRCGNEAAVTPIIVSDDDKVIVLSASHSGYERFGLRCHRKLRLRKGSLVIEDQIQGSGMHELDLFFHLGPGWDASVSETSGEVVACEIYGTRSLALSCKGSEALHLAVDSSEISRAYGSSFPAKRIHISTAGQLPVNLTTCIEWNRQ
jgi:hypothetical protein